MSQVVQGSSHKKNLYLIGGGGHCQAVIDAVETSGEYNLVGIFDTKEKVGTKIFQYPIIDTDKAICNYINAESWFLITIGHLRSNAKRVELFNFLKNSGANIATIISKSAAVSAHATIGPGTVVMANATVSAGANIGVNCILNSKALVEHNCQIGDHCHISTNATINGNVKICDHVFFGSSATTKQGISISSNSFVKACTLVKNDI